MSTTPRELPGGTHETHSQPKQHARSHPLDLGDSKKSNKQQNMNLIHLEKRSSMVLLFIQKRCVQIFPAYDIERLWSFFETVIVLKPTRTHIHTHTLQHLKHRKGRSNPTSKYSYPHPISHLPCILTALSISLGNKYVCKRKWESYLLNMKRSTERINYTV